MKRILAIFGVIVLALAAAPGEAAGASSSPSDGKQAGSEGAAAGESPSSPDEETRSSASARRDPSQPADTGLVEKVRVTATRLPGAPEEASRIPAHVTVYTRQEIQASGAATLQDFLALRSDFVVFDEVGNGLESTADLRGFNTGSLATAALVVVDGVRVNEPDTGYVNFELIPLFDVERVEVIRGSSSALFGEGGLGGVINVVTRSGGDAARLEAALSGGSFSSKTAAVSSGGRRGRLSYHAGLGYLGSDGFRDNSGTRASSFAGKAEWQLTANQSLGVDLTAETNHLDQPGALTAAELRQNRKQSPFNKNDFSATDLYLPGLRYRLLRPGGFSLTSRLSFRDSAEDGFNGGRSGLGSQSEVDRMGLAWTIQAAQEKSFGARSNQAVLGAEIARDRFDTGQIRTDSEGNPLPESDFSHSVSHADSTRRFLGLFLQDTFQFGPKVSVTGGVRLDRIRLASSGRQASYDFSAAPPVLTEGETGGDRDFSQVSPRLGVNFNPGEKTALYAGYSRGFRAPTVIELFAFPIFFSNPDLDPVHSDDFEAGWSRRVGESSTLSLNGFWIDVQDEIFFVLTDPSQFLGINLNLPRTRRRGAVFTAGTRLGEHFLGELGATYTDAAFRTSFDDANIGSRVEKGDRLPQIPRLKYSARLDVMLGGGWKAGLQDIYVERQVLTSDLGNDAPQLPPYNVLNARISYARGKWEGFFQADNVLDRLYSTRGIYAFNFSSFSFDQFYTPAPGRHFLAGATFRY
ncbi:MAG TPA: TonB-dependent receptor [Candidatus Polarisedimenticolia bacterium]|jgi:outer membrane receptor protein involved in Fe transport|nr:TonB-dependent receptor [Candidatus Polarisedimenticolia bacterium]